MGDHSQLQQSISTPPPSSSAMDSRRNSKGKSGPKYIERVHDPSVEFLESLGIKVRDFQYESILPPVATYVRPPRSDPAVAASSSGRPACPPRPLKRTQADGTEVEDNGFGFVMGVARTAPDEASRPRKMLRPDMEASQLPSRSQASLPPPKEATLLSIAESRLRAACSVVGSSQGYYLQRNSQDRDNIPTPIVTPNGSLIWINGEPPLAPTEPASPAPTEPNSEQDSASSVPLALSESPTPASRRHASAQPRPLRRASRFPSQLQPLVTDTSTPPASPPPPAAPAPLAIITSAPPPLPPIPAHAYLDVLPPLGAFSSLSTLSSPLSEPPPSPPQQQFSAPSPPPRYQLRKRTGMTAALARASKQRRPV